MHADPREMVQDYTKLLNEEMVRAFPELAEFMPPIKQELATNGDGANATIDLTLDEPGEVKMEE